MLMKLTPQRYKKKCTCANTMCIFFVFTIIYFICTSMESNNNSMRRFHLFLAYRTLYPQYLQEEAKQKFFYQLCGFALSPNNLITPIPRTSYGHFLSPPQKVRRNCFQHPFSLKINAPFLIMQSGIIYTLYILGIFESS